MGQKKTFLKFQVAWLGIISSGIFPGMAIAQPAQSQVNPCPQIFYESPLNTTIPAPAGCPPNQSFPSLMRPPLPGEQQPVATVQMVNQTVEVQMINLTAGDVAYEVISGPEQGMMRGDVRTPTTINLHALSTPFTINLFGEDGSMLNGLPQPTETPGELVIWLVNLETNKNTVTMQESGEVFVY